MSAIQEIFQLHGPEYLRRYGHAMPAAHRKALHAIQNCRSGDFGVHLYDCLACGQLHVLPAGCGNRHCPTCQQGKAVDWLDKQMQKLLPCPYFLITFTIPEELRPLVRSHQKVAYAALFQAAAEALKKLAKDERFLGADQLGGFAVLHTWGKQLQYHPHVHFIVPGGGLAKDRENWVPSRQDFFVHVKPLSIIYRAKFRDALDKAGLLDEVDPAVWKKDWTVHSKPVGDGQASLKYLAPYVFRVALSNRRIVSHDEQQVTFRYRKPNGAQWQTVTLKPLEFMRRFLQHVLPTGFMKVRHYGFLSPNAATPLEVIRKLIAKLYEVVQDFLLIPLRAAASAAEPVVCPRCGQPLRWRTFVPPAWAFGY